MKKILSMMACLSALLMFSACGDDEDEIKYVEPVDLQEDYVTTLDADGVTINSATLYGTIDTEVNPNTQSLEFGFIYSSTEKTGAALQYYTTSSSTKRRTCYSVNEGDSFSLDLAGLTFGTKYYYRAYARVDGELRYGEVKMFSTRGAASGTYNKYDYVDLGLPSGLRWATCNIGSSTPSYVGTYMQWGNTVEKGTYISDYCTLSDYVFTDLKALKAVDDKGNLSADYDAATAMWGGKWRMPTTEEVEELRDKCTWAYTTLNSTSGYMITGPNGNCIFLPNSGYRYAMRKYSYYYGEYYYSTETEAAYEGYYWTATAYPYDDRLGSYCMRLTDYNIQGDYNMTRYYGCPIRPVFKY